MGEPGEQHSCRHATYPIGSCASWSFEWAGRCHAFGSRLRLKESQWTSQRTPLAGIHADPLLLLLERLHHEPEKRSAPISSTVRVEGNWPRQRE